MADLNDLLVRIDATTEQLRREMKKAEDITEGSTRKMDRSLEKIDKRMVALAKRAAAWGAAMVSAFAVAGGVKLVQIARETDILDAQLKTATGSAEGAAKAFAELERFAAETPFALQEVVNAFVKLKNLGLDPSRAALESYGNTASAMGKSLNQFIEAVADAATAEFERLKEFGIRSKNQGDTIAFTFRGVTETVANNAQAIEGYLRKLGQNEFAGAMQERVNSLDGALSNLADSWDALFRTIARGPIGSLIEEYVREATSAIERLDRMLAQLMGTATPLEMLQNQLDELFLRRQRLEQQLATPNPMGRAFFGQLSEELEAVKAQIEGTQEALRHFKSEAENSAANAPRSAPQIFPTVTVLKKKKKKDEPFDPSESMLSRESDRIQQAVAEVDRFFEATMTETEQLERQIARVQELASQGFFALRGVDDEEILRRLNEQLEAVQSKTDESSSQIAEVLANNVGGAIDEMFASGELSAQRFFEAMLRDIARIAVQLYIMKPLIEGLFGAGGGAGKFGQGLFKAFGFARGADFTVGGSGGQDSQFMPMMLSPGERVKITPAGKSSGDVSVTVIDQRGAGAPPVDVSEQLVGMQRQIQVLVRGEVAGMYRDGSIDKLNGAVGFPVRRRGSR